jgi:hypothetical protein
MPFDFQERAAPQLTTVPPTATLRFRATGEFSESTAHAYATALTPALYAHPTGAILYRQDIAMDGAGYKIFNVDVPYASQKHDTGSFQLSFDTTGGTVHITASKETIGAYGSGAAVADHKQSIGVTGPDKDPEGADVVIPVLKLTATFRHPQGHITLPQIKNLARWTGKVNSDTFLTFAAGEVLFLGCTGSEGTDQPVEIQYHFACNENLTNLSIGGITVANKLGHNLYWIQYKSAIANNAGTRQPKAVYVERVYDTLPLAASLGFGAAS